LKRLLTISAEKKARAPSSSSERREAARPSCIGRCRNTHPFDLSERTRLRLRSPLISAERSFSVPPIPIGCDSVRESQALLLRANFPHRPSQRLSKNRREDAHGLRHHPSTNVALVSSVAPRMANAPPSGRTCHLLVPRTTVRIRTPRRGRRSVARARASCVKPNQRELGENPCHLLHLFVTQRPAPTLRLFVTDPLDAVRIVAGLVRSAYEVLNIGRPLQA